MRNTTVVGLLALATCMMGAFTLQQAQAAEAETPTTVLTLPTSEENPRNGEGDFVQLENGDILHIYTHFKGLSSGDHSPAHLASRISKDGGRTWSQEDRMEVENHGEMNVMSLSLLRLQDGRIGLFYMLKDSTADAPPMMRTSSDEGQTWSAPKQIIPDEAQGYYVLNNDRVVQLENGRLIVPVSQHHGLDYDEWTGYGTQLCYISDDGGKTWLRSESELTGEQPEGKRVMLQEPGVIELKDGRLMMWCRTDQGVQYVSYSDDKGNTWSPMKPSDIVSSRSPASIERIPSTGDLLLVWNRVDSKEGLPRTPLNVAISKDEGETWINQKALEDDPNAVYCYTAIEFLEDAVLLSYYTGGGPSKINRVPLSWVYEEGDGKN